MTTPAHRPARVHVRPVPQTSPTPLGNDEVLALYSGARELRRRLPDRSRPYVQGTLAIDFRHRGEDPYFGPQATARTELPDPQRWAQHLLGAVLESVAGTRSPQQLGHWLSTPLLELVTRRHKLRMHRGRQVSDRPHVRRVRVHEPTDGVAEVAALVWLEGRFRAVALRLNGVDGRWLATSLQIG